MSITLELPPEMEAKLRRELPEFDKEAITAVALDLFRREKISLSVFGKMLGMDRFQANAFLNARGEFAQTLTLEELEEDYQNLCRLMKEHGR